MHERITRSLCAAGVLIPVIERVAGLSVLLTQRSADLKHHAGQVSFPGGRMEEHDADVVQTALREMAVGVTRREAFRGVRDRTRSESVGSFVTALLQAEELGVPLSHALKDIAAEVRRDRAQQVRRQAAKASSKVALVVTTTMVPGALILMMAGLVLANIDTIQGLFE